MLALLLAAAALADPREDAVALLAEGERGRAIQLLALALPADRDGALRCLLGRVEHQAGRDAEALATLADLPDGAPCALEAAWIRAEARLALGDAAGALAATEALAEGVLGPDRDARTALRLEGMVDRVLAREQPDEGQAAEILALALDLDLTPAGRLALARRLADLPSAGARSRTFRQAVPALAEAVAATGEAADLRRLARLVGGEDGLALLAPLDLDPESRALRLEVGRGRDLGWRSAVGRQLAGFQPSPGTRAVRLALGRELVAAGLAVEAETLLRPLAEEGGEQAAAACQALAELARAAGAPGEEQARLEALVARFPRAGERAGAEERLPEVRLLAARAAFEAGDREGALARYDALVTAHPARTEAARAALEAGRVVRLLGELAEARRRWEEIPARWPGGEEAAEATRAVYDLIALDQDAPAEAEAWLEARARAGQAEARALREALEEPALALDADGGGSVRVVARGLAEVELRLHEVDLPTWLRAGFAIADLPALDVGVIAPARTWRAAVPGPRPFAVPVRLPGPGLYAVTAASPEREARALLLRSDTRILAERAGPELFVAVFAAGRPVQGARVRVREDGAVAEVATDARGLARVRTAGNDVLVLAECAAGPALLELPGVVASAPTEEPFLAVDLDRPVHRPGDSLGFRVVVDRPAPAEGRTWTLWLDGGPGYSGLVRRTFEERADGTLSGEIPLPLGQVGHAGIAGLERRLRLMARLPDGSERSLGSVRLVDELPEGRRLTARVDGGGALLALREEDGEPAVGQALDWIWEETGVTGRVVTDAAGEARVAAPPAGVPWTLRATVPGSTLAARTLRPRPAPRALALGGPQDRLRPGEPVALVLDGQGEATLRIRRWEDPRPEPAGPPDPWDLAPRWTWEPEGPVSWSGPAAPATGAVRRTLLEWDLGLDGLRQVELPALPPGRYEAEACAPDGCRTWPFSVLEGGPRLLALPATGAGGTLPLAVEGEPALVVVRSGASVAGLVLLPGQRAPWPVGFDARGEVTVQALTPSGVAWSRALPLPPALAVEVAVEEQGTDWVLRVRTRDGAGRPLPAQVVVRALDLALIARVGGGPSPGAGPLRPGPSWGEAGGWSAGLRHGAWSEAVAAALLEEAARQEEARRARRALDGAFADNAVAGLLGADVPLAERGGGLGAMGYGGGGGSIGAAGGDAIILGGHGGRGGLPERPLQGERGRAFWAVLDTDAAGEAALRVARPARAAAWRVEAVAAARGWVARADSEVATPGDPEAERRADGAPALAADPTVGWDPGRAVVAARAALAGLPALDARARATALDRVDALLGAVASDPAAFRGVGEAASMLALLGELSDLRPLPRGTAAAFADAVAVERAAPAERAALFAARVRAGLAVDEASASRLLREAPDLPDEAAAALARALVRLGREAEAAPLVRGQGPEAWLARRTLAGSRRARAEVDAAARASLDDWPAPSVGDPGRPAWIEALVAFGATGGGPAPAAPEPLAARAIRLPRAADGLPVRAAVPAEEVGAWTTAPRLAVGDALRVDGGLGRALLGAGLERVPDPDGVGFLLRARSPGTWEVHGIELPDDVAGLRVEVGGTVAAPLAEQVALALAREAAAAGLDPRPLLDGRPRLEDWAPTARPEAAALRLRGALAVSAPAADVVAAFEDLRDVAPGTRFALAELAAVARAYGPSEPVRALAVLRAAIGQAFEQESAATARCEDVLGPLAALQVTREIAARYPGAPAVVAALHALPDRLLDLSAGGDLPPEIAREGVTPVDLRLMSAAWNREFLALFPDSDLAPSAGERLVVDLLHLSAWAPAADWARRLGAANDGHPLGDDFLYLEGLARGGAGEPRRAAALLRRVEREDFVGVDGLLGPSDLRADAGLALARILEAGGDLAGAARAYGEASSDLAEAEASLALLSSRALDLSAIRVLEPGEPAVLPLTVAGVDQVLVRAWRLDLRTLFLRDGGLDAVREVQVAGLAPAWAGERRVRERPFPTRVDLRLPLDEPGAWLVQLFAGDLAATTLLVRSELLLVAHDAGGLRRLTVLRRGEPAAGVEVRALSGGRVVAAVTDARGAAVVPAFAPALAFAGPHYAFTEGAVPGPVAPFEGGDELLRRVDARLAAQRAAGW